MELYNLKMAVRTCIIVNYKFVVLPWVVSEEFGSDK